MLVHDGTISIKNRRRRAYLSSKFARNACAEAMRYAEK
jgi:hypothetical protein